MSAHTESNGSAPPVTPPGGVLRGVDDITIPGQREPVGARTGSIPGLPTAGRNNLDRTLAWGLLWVGMLALGLTAIGVLVIALAASPWNVIAWVLTPLFAVKTAVLLRLGCRALGIAVLGHGRRRFRG